MKSPLKSFILFFFLSSTLFSQSANWQQTNGPLNGDVNALIILNPDSIIAGTRLGGLYRSTDGGNNWQHIEESAEAPFLFVSVLDFKQNSQGDIFAATSNGVYRSLDRGDSWEAFSEGLVHRFTEGLAINSADVIFAGTRSGVFRSEDNGETWVEFNNGLTNQSLNDITITPLGDVIASSQNGVFYSDDNGDNWNEISAGLDNKYVYTVFTVSEDTFLTYTHSGAYISTNHGSSWDQLNDIFGIILSYGRQNDSLLYAGGSGYFFRSLDNGITWTPTLPDKLDFASFYDLQFKSDKIYAATYRYGIMQSSDSGATWQQTNAGLTISDAKRFASNAAGDIFLGSGEGVFRTSDGGDNWEWVSDVNLGINTRAFGIGPTGRIFAGTSGSMVISDDNSDTWDYADTTLSERFPESIAFGNGNDVYVGFWGKIFKSTNGGDTWTETPDSLPETTIQVMAVANDSTVFAGTKDNGVLRSTDSGETWEEVNTGFGDYLEITAFVFEPSGSLLATNFDGVYRSSNNGNSWEKLGNVPTWGLKDLKQDSKGNLFVSMRGGGVAVSEDDGMSWSYINTGLWQKDAQGLFIDDMDNIYIGTRGAGVFKTQFTATPVAIEDIDQHPEEFKLEQNYPNPFNPETKIEYIVRANHDSPQRVNLSIYNLLGQKVITLVNKKQAAGKYSVTWDGRDITGNSVSSGVYIYKLSTNDAVQSKKMLFLK